MQRHPEYSVPIHYVPVGSDLKRVAEYIIRIDRSPASIRYANDVLNGVKVPSHELVEKASVFEPNQGKRGIFRVLASSVLLIS